MKKIIITLIAAILACGSLFGCGAKQKPPADSEVKTETKSDRQNSENNRDDTETDAEKEAE